MHQSIPSRCIPSPKSIETVCVQLSIPHPVLVFVVYIPPNASDSFITDTLSFISSAIGQADVIIMGDFNCPKINWDCLNYADARHKKLCDFVYDNALQQLVQGPTHVKGNTLDLVFVNQSNLVAGDVCIGSNTPFPLLSSDHNIVRFQVHSHKTKILQSPSPMTPWFIFPKGDFSGLNNFIATLDFSTFYDFESPWLVLRSIISEGCMLFVPVSIRRKCQFPKWFNGQIIHQLHKLRSVRRKARQFPSVRLIMPLKGLEQRLSTLVSKSKASYESSLVHDFAFRKNHRIFSYIRSFNKPSSIPSTMVLNGIEATSDDGVATLFNDFFHSTFTKGNQSSPDQTSSLHDVPGSISNIYFTIANVYESLAKLDVAKAMGLDGISNYVLKYCAESLCEPLCHLFSECMRQSYLPEEWRTHKVVPVYSEKCNIMNYRPISLLSCVSKVLEDLVYNNIPVYIATSPKKSQIHNLVSCVVVLLFSNFSPSITLFLGLPPTRTNLIRYTLT